MTKTKALQSFMSGFGLTAYPANGVPENAPLPYMTYIKGFDFEGFSSTLHVYYHTESELTPDLKAEEICKKIGKSGQKILYEGGQLWITLENPEWYAADDTADTTVKHRVINIAIRDL